MKQPKQSHTRGPWRVESGGMSSYVFANNGKKTVAIVTSKKLADMRLIASAPELLEALIAAYDLIEYARESGTYAFRGGDHYIQTSRVHAALCKALNLNYKTVTREDFDKALNKARGDK